MWYVVTLFLGMLTGALCMGLAVMDWYAKTKKKAQASETLARRGKEASVAAEAKEKELAEISRRLFQDRQQLDSRTISYGELEQANKILKRDLQNIDVQLHKLELDGELQREQWKELDERSTQLAKRYLSESVKAIVSSIGPNNFTACKDRLIDVIARCRAIRFSVSEEEQSSLLAELRKEFERAVRSQFEREEQARIRAQIREEERLKREIERELKQAEREQAAIQAALDQALAAAKGEFTAEVERLRARLAEAIAKSQHAMSMAQQTKAGHVYVISNIGTFGEGVFKIGMTRRLDPKERVSELGCAAVPFPFDVHMMISCDNAPALENALHRALFRRRVNKANPRKEFFRVPIEEIRQIVKEHHGEVDYIADPEALEYRQSITMPDDDLEYIERVYDAAEEEPIADDV
jgi:hypothetical protein